MTSILKHETIVVENYFDFQCSHALLPCRKHVSVCSSPGIAFRSSYCNQTREFVHFAKLKSSDLQPRSVYVAHPHLNTSQCTYIVQPVADPGFSGGANSQSGCSNLLFCNFISRKLHQNERNWAPPGGGGTRPWRPLRSANELLL